MGLRYEGRFPDSDSSLGTKEWAEGAAQNSAVTTTYINNEIARVVTVNNLQTTSYVDGRDALLAKLADVQSADAACLPLTARNSTVAGLNETGTLYSGQLSNTIITERAVKCFVGTVAFSGTHTCTQNSLREKKLATVNIVDPGFSYIPLPFGFITGQAGGTPTLYPWSGNGVCGRVVVCPPEGSGDTVYGLGACTDTSISGRYPILPSATANATPANLLAVKGNLTLDLYGSCFQGTGYTFSSEGLSFYVLIFPAM